MTNNNMTSSKIRVTKVQWTVIGVVVGVFLFGVVLGYNQGSQNITPAPPAVVEQPPQPLLLVPALNEKEISPTGGYQLPGATTDFIIDEEAEAKMLELTNKARRDAGVRELTLNSKLLELARTYDNEMLSSANFAHTDKHGKNPFDRMEAAGISFRAAGENIALAPSIDEVFGGLMRSPGHKENILSSDFTEIGIGVVFSSRYGYVVDQEFIKPQ